MTYLHVIAGSQANTALPVVRKIAMRALKDALAKGIDDFRAFPTHVVFLSMIYPIIGLVLAAVTISYDLLPLLFPLAAGFALVGPFAAIGLYELSRQRELGLDMSWTDVFGALRSQSTDGIIALGVFLLIIFALWVAVAQAIYIANFGYAPAPLIPDFLNQVFTTQAGWTLIIVGNGVGFLFAAAVLTISIVSFPLLLDRDVGAVVAVLTSVRAEESVDHRRMGVDRCHTPGDRFAAAVRRTCGDNASARAFYLALVSQTGGTGPAAPTRAAASAATTALRRTISGRPVRR
jgi:uncharacterized membrane protein